MIICRNCGKELSELSKEGSMIYKISTGELRQLSCEECGKEFKDGDKILRNRGDGGFFCNRDCFEEYCVTELTVKITKKKEVGE